MIELTAAHVDEAVARSLRSEAYFDAAVLDIPGFSTPTMRRLFSNLCHLEELKYLEVGCFAGGTFCAAFNNNPIHAVGIENYSQTFGQMLDIKRILADNIVKFGRMSALPYSLSLFESDCFEMDVILRDWRFDVLFYDGLHEELAQAKALPYLFPLLADRFLFIVDDFAWTPVHSGTAQGFNALTGKLEIENGWLLSDGRPDGPVWHNDVKIYLCSKIK